MAKGDILTRQQKHLQLELPDLSLAALDRFAAAILPFLKAGDFIALEGELGSGKTAFARALILRLLEDSGKEDIPSPSFAIVQSYETPRFQVHHFDFYRLSGADEIRELGLEEALDSGLVLAEWPDRLENELPEDRLEIHLKETGDLDRRHLKIVGCGRFAARLQRYIDVDRFLFRAGWSTAWRRFLQGDASSRTYTRLGKTNATALLMDAPRQPDGPPLRDGKPYSIIAHLAEDVRPFVAIGNALRQEGYSTPEILCHDLDKGLLLLEDFGDRQFGDLIKHGRAEMVPLYEKASRLLAELALRPPPARLPLPDGPDFILPSYDLEACCIELELLPDWFWPAVKGRDIADDLRAEFLHLWQTALEPTFANADSWVLRDVHSPNLMWLPERQGSARIGIIDFQDAQRGHRAYDLVSLLQDARLDVPPSLESDCLDVYISIIKAREAGFDEADFRAAYAVYGAQRATKILGIFMRLAKRDHKPAYLAHIPRVAACLDRNLQHPALAGLRKWHKRHMPAELYEQFLPRPSR